MMDWSEASRILGVSESATEAEIKDQYFYKAQLLHPDKNQDKPEHIRKKAEAEFALVNQAYNFLTNPANNPYRNPPKLSIDPVGIRFRDISPGEKKTTTVVIANAGGPYTSMWIDNNPAPWLAVTSVKSLTDERLPLELTLEATGNGEPGREYLADLLIKLENEHSHALDQAVVKIELYIKPAPPASNTPKDPPAPAAAAKTEIPRPRPQPVPRPAQANKNGFSFATFLVDFLALAAVGSAAAYAVLILLKPDRFIFIIALVVYTIAVFAISLVHAASAGARSGKKPPP